MLVDVSGFIACVRAERRAHNRLTVAVQLTSVRYLGRFVPALRQAPAEVAGYPAEQWEITDPSCLMQYGGRDGTAHPCPSPRHSASTTSTSHRSERGDRRRPPRGTRP
ncbi:DUF4158 domain-containing protein [Streptomyces sp. x-80]|uniref:DUF4158 domain-containing protein n=1 Tax=Streptomyces sp. x-80 TaxID=2789282 RepID=UPI003980E867